MPASTRVCATSSAIISVIDATSTLWRESAVMNSTAAQPANAIAAWPLGRPPRTGVPRPVAALTAITISTTSTSAITVRCTGDSRTRASAVDVGDDSRSANTV